MFVLEGGKEVEEGSIAYAAYGLRKRLIVTNAILARIYLSLRHTSLYDRHAHFTSFNILAIISLGSPVTLIVLASFIYCRMDL